MELRIIREMNCIEPIQFIKIPPNNLMNQTPNKIEVSKL